MVKDTDRKFHSAFFAAKTMASFPKKTYRMLLGTRETNSRKVKEFTDHCSVNRV